jgi:hypothetical protein
MRKNIYAIVGSVFMAVPVESWPASAATLRAESFDGRFENLVATCVAAFQGSSLPNEDMEALITRTNDCAIYIGESNIVTYECETPSDNTSCIKNAVRDLLRVPTNEGQFAGPPCDKQQICTYYFDFFDKDEIYRQRPEKCGFHIGGIAKILNRDLAYNPSIWISAACFMRR